MQDYIKFIYELEQTEGKASTSRLAELMGVADASATNMVKRLADLGLVERQPYKGVTLTGEGEKIALEVLRHHRLIELYLARALGYPWDKVHAEAERLEHVISEYFEDRVDQLLGYPTVDVHGSPIPTKDGEIEEQDYVPLESVQIGERVAVRRVLDRDPKMLSYLSKIGLTLGVELEVTGRHPFDGPLVIETGGDRHIISLELARHIFVEPAAKGSGG
ncbi:metal-dependent transcriptional regulator [Rubrobacter taiwanensis]|uniref:Manganese transport regulator n=2 Tax=Rubrobacter taiwanensis TaxID=185139 RepID=A0A4R1BF06_9ACTN|nr:metal-dependent transcriptional regulator [Rubrobacter taiwanensis]